MSNFEQTVKCYNKQTRMLLVLFQCATSKKYFNPMLAFCFRLVLLYPNNILWGFCHLHRGNGTIAPVTTVATGYHLSKNKQKHMWLFTSITKMNTYLVIRLDWFFVLASFVWPVRSIMRCPILLHKHLYHEWVGEYHTFEQHCIRLNIPRQHICCYMCY